MSERHSRALGVVVRLAEADEGLTLAELAAEGETERQARSGVDLARGAGLVRCERGRYVLTGGGRKAADRLAVWPRGEH